MLSIVLVEHLKGEGGMMQQYDEPVLGDRVLTPDGSGTVTAMTTGPFADSVYVVLDKGVGEGEYWTHEIEIVPSRTARRFNVPFVCDGCGRTATTSVAGGAGGHRALCPECLESGKKAKNAKQAKATTKRSARVEAPLLPLDELKARGLHVASEDYPELGTVLWDRPDLIATRDTTLRHVTLAKQASVRKQADDDARKTPRTRKEINETGPTLDETKQYAGGWFFNHIIAPAMEWIGDRILSDGDRNMLEAPANNWCKWRSDQNGHCWHPGETGESQDNGLCRRWRRDEQRVCPIGEPKDGTPVRMGFRHRIADQAPIAREAHWTDVQEKAHRLRGDAKVRIIDVQESRVVAEVEGDHGSYQTWISRVPGTKQRDDWNCTCPWGSTFCRERNVQLYLEDRPCAHAQALYNEIQSQEMFGGAIHVNASARKAQEGSKHDGIPADSHLAELAAKACRYRDPVHAGRQQSRIRTAADIDLSDGVMVALPVSQSLGEQLHAAGEQAGLTTVPIGEHHITVMYLGATDDVPQSDLLTRIVEAWAAGVQPVEADITGVWMFSGTGNGDCIYADVEVPETFRSARESLVAALGEVGIKSASSYDDWVAHITIGYADTGEGDVTDVIVPSCQLRFDQVCVVYGGEWTYLQLGSGQTILQTEAQADIESIKHAPEPALPRTYGDTDTDDDDQYAPDVDPEIDPEVDPEIDELAADSDVPGFGTEDDVSTTVKAALDAGDARMLGGGDSDNSEIAMAARAGMKQALRSFTKSEQDELINEPGCATNDDVLDVAGTFYEGALASSSSDSALFE